MSMWTTPCVMPRIVKHRLKSNRALIVSLGLVFLVCFSYLEIFFVDSHHKYAPRYNLKGKFNNRSHHLSPKVTNTPRKTDNNPTPETLANPLYANHSETLQSGRFRNTPNCRELSFESIRWKTNWKEDLSLRYAAWVKGLRGDVEPTQELLRIPKWQAEIRRQKYVVAASFQPIISEMEFKILMETFYTLAEALIQANITFFLYGGSHLGVYRHHGLVPWDDDIDIMVDSSEREKAKQVLSSIPYYTLYSPTGRQWKFFETSLTTILHKPFRWPFVDIFFFAQNSTHIWDEIPLYKNTFCFPKTAVFPLVFRPFEGGNVPVPCNPEETLRRSYHTDICKSNTYWHKFEAYAPRSRKKIIRCSLLSEIFPFVFRSTNSALNCGKEKLKQGKTILSEISYKDSCKYDS